MVVKLTEATSYTNPYAQSQINNAMAAGMKVSAYHYSWFTTDAQAKAEANYFAAAAKKFGLSSGTVMVNDIEEPQILGKGNHTNNSRAFENQLKSLGYGNVRHYIGLNWLTTGRINASVIGIKIYGSLRIHIIFLQQILYTIWSMAMVFTTIIPWYQRKF